MALIPNVRQRALPLPLPPVALPLPDAWGARRFARPTLPRLPRLDRLPWGDAAAQAVLAGAALLLLFPALTRGAVRWQDDTKYFYYPLLADVAAALRQGRLPLWEPGIFGGYPLFADGEAGMLYPPHLILLRLLDPAAALVALRLLRFYLAGAFTYAFLRSVAASRAAATVAGLAFALSGFMVGQVVHENLDSGMVWLPLALCFVERAVRAAAPRRYLLAAFAGVALAMQALAVHVQVCAFTVLLVFPYLGWRVLFPDTIRARLGTHANRVCVGTRLPGRLLIGAGLGIVAAGVAAGLSAVQLLPLLDAAHRSARGAGISLAAATINSVTPFRLLELVAPDLLRSRGHPMGYWVDWDVTVFVGLPVLFLAAVAVLVRLDRYTCFFGLAALAALALSTGRYGPPWVVAVTRALLGEHGLRSPGRFAFLWSFAAAVLAGLGADFLERGKACSGRWRRPWLAAVCALLAGVAGGLLLAAGTGHAWLLANPGAATDWIARRFVAFDPTAPLSATAADIYRTLLAALDPACPTTAVWALSVVASYALLVAWFRMSRPASAGSDWRRTVHTNLLRALTAAWVAVPLLARGAYAHPEAPVQAIRPDSGATAYLRAALAPPGAAPAKRPLYRVYTSQPVYLYQDDVEPNALLPLGVQEAGGYSSLSTTTNLAYAWAAETGMGRMIDIWNARYFLWPNAPVLLPSHELTSYHPQRPLVSGSGFNTGARAWFRVPSVVGENVRVVATLRDAAHVPPGTVVAWVTAVDDAGAAHRWPLRMGVDLQDATAPLAAPLGQRAYGRPMAVAVWDEPLPGGLTHPVYLYYEVLRLPAPATIVRLGIAPVPLPKAPETILRVYGLGVGLPTWEVHNVTWLDRERFTLAHADDEVEVYRNETALPRAYLLPLAVPLDRAAHIKELAERSAEPERMLLVDASPDVTDAPDAPNAPEWPLEGPWAPYGTLGWTGSTETGGAEDDGEPGVVRQPAVRAVDDLGRVAVSPAGESRIITYESDRVVVQTAAPHDAWLFLADTWHPAWHAYVDGAPRPVRLADAMFRAVAVPSGEHVVEFRYESAPLGLGAALSLATGLVVLAACAGPGLLTWWRQLGPGTRSAGT